MRELRAEGTEIPDIPIEWDDDRPTLPEPIPACRVHVEKPVASYTLPPTPGRILIVPDTHAPFHDRLVWGAMLDWAHRNGPWATVIHLGDLADFYSVSDHDKDPRRAHNLVEECAVTNNLIADLNKLGAAHRVFCKGNHEYRLDRYLMRQAPALLGAVSLDGLLHLDGWLQVPYGQMARVGNLHATHDVGKSGQNATQQTAAAVGHNVVFGHTHRAQLLYFGTALGERYVSATCGWLGDTAAADYVSTTVKAQWQHAFGVAEMDARGDFGLQLKPIVAGRVL